MSHAFDHALMFRSVATNLTQSETSSAIKLRSTPVRGMAARIVIPSTTGTTNDLVAKIYSSDDDVTYNLISQYVGGRVSWLSGGKEWMVPFVTTEKYVKLELTVAGSTGVPIFGNVQAGIVLAGFDYDRGVDFA